MAKHPGAVSLGKLRMKGLSAEERREFARKGGKVGGKKRAEALTAKRRREIAIKAAAARWGEKEGSK
jgi:hypothetical protein